MTDREVDEALGRSFLAELPAELAVRLREEGERADYPAGTTVYRAGDDPQAALVIRGLIRVFLSSPGGRQVTVRYARPGDVLGIAVLVGGPAATGVQTVEPSSVFRISSRTLITVARRDPPGLDSARPRPASWPEPSPPAWTAGPLFGAALVTDATGAQVTINE